MYKLYEIPVILTANDVSSIVSAYSPRACTVKETVTDNDGNRVDVFLMLQSYDKQYALLEETSDDKDVIIRALSRVGLASGLHSLTYDQLSNIKDSISEIETEQIEGPWKDTSAEWGLISSCIERVKDLESKINVLNKSYMLLTYASKTPVSSVMCFNKSYSVIDDVADKVTVVNTVPSVLTGVDVFVVCSDLPENGCKRIFMYESPVIVFNTLQCYDKIFDTKPDILTTQVNAVVFCEEYGGRSIVFDSPIDVLCVEKNSLDNRVSVIVKGITPEGDEVNLVFGINVNGKPVIWDLVGFGITYPDNVPSSYGDKENAERFKLITNFVINVIPTLGWGPMSVTNITWEE